MLVLSRKIGERIHIGDNITIEIRRVAGNRVTLALDAPRTVRILRGELEQAAREFRGCAELQTGAEFQNAAEFQNPTASEGTNGCQQPSGFAQPTENDTQPGPEPYAVIHRRLHVVPAFSPQPLSHPAIS
jgi:carbon storage regulator